MKMEENKNQKENVLPGYFRGYKKEINNTLKKEDKVQFESASNKKKYDFGNPIIIITILAVVFTAIVLLWAVYSVIHISRLSELAGIHLTKDFQQAANQLINKEKNDYELARYENWQTHKNDVFELKYPQNWTIENKNDEVIIRKFNKKVHNYFDSLAVSISIKQLENPDGLEVSEYLEINKFPTGEKKQIELGEKTVLHTGMFKNSHGLVEKIAYWKFSKKIMQLDAIFFNDNHEELLEDFEKIIQSIKLL
jgi:hypothetical protein